MVELLTDDKTSINNKNLAIANKPRDAATLFQIKKDDLEMTLKRSLKVIANNTMGFPIQYNTKFVMHRCHRILRKTNKRRNIPHQTAVDLELVTMSSSGADICHFQPKSSVVTTTSPFMAL